LYFCIKKRDTMSKTTKRFRVVYDVHPTPNTNGKPTTYHARRISQTMSGRYLRDHIEKTSIISAGTFELVLETLKREIPEQLLKGLDIHFEGLGTFYLKIGSKHKGYTDPQAITARELNVEGIGFIADKSFNERVRHEAVSFEREEQWQSNDIDENQVVVALTDYCRQHGYFTIHTLISLFHLTKYKASRLANQLVNAPYPKFTRYKEGNTYIYKRVDE